MTSTNARPIRDRPVGSAVVRGHTDARVPAGRSRPTSTSVRALLRLRASDERSRDIWFFAILVLTWVYTIGVSTVQSFTAPKYRTNILQAGVPLSGLTQRVQSFSLLLLLGVCALVVILSLGNLPRSKFVALAVVLAPWFYIVIRDRYLFVAESLNFGIYPMVVIAVWCLRPKLNRLAWLGYLVGATAVLALAMGQFLPAKGVYQASSGTEISVDKEIFSSGLLVGPLSNGNNLGQFLVIGLGAVLLIPRPAWRWGLMFACVLAAVWAASRSCLVAIVLLLLMALLQRGLPLRLRGIVTFLAVVPMAGLIAILPAITTDPQAFTNRGGIWTLLKQQWAAEPWLGLGTNFFGRIAATSSNLGGSVFHGHNQFVQAVVTGGYVYAILLGLVVAALLGAAIRHARVGRDFPTLYLVGLLGASTLEVSFVVVDRYFAMSVMLVPLAVVLFADVQKPVDAQPPGAVRERPTGLRAPASLGSAGSAVGSDRRRHGGPAGPRREARP